MRLKEGRRTRAKRREEEKEEEEEEEEEESRERERERERWNFGPCFQSVASQIKQPRGSGSAQVNDEVAVPKEQQI